MFGIFFIIGEQKPFGWVVRLSRGWHVAGRV